MGSAYGGGAVHRRTALWLVAACALLGAVTGSHRVVRTIAGGIVPPELVSLPVAVVILAAAGITLFLANWFGIPLSTSQVTVGAIIGVGMAYGSLDLRKVGWILAGWAVVPVAAFAVAYALCRWVETPARNLLYRVLERRGRPEASRRALAGVLVGAGAYEAVAAGMNNVGNAIGPLVAAGVLPLGSGVVMGGLAMGAGAVMLGARVLETNGRKITRLSLARGTIVSFTSGSLVILASLFGYPVPLTQATTMAIIGVSSAAHGIGRTWRNGTVRAILSTWAVSPVGSLALAYLMMLRLLGTAA